MITAEAFRGKRYAVLGLARSGTATVESLLASGARVIAWDSDETKRQPFLSFPSGEGPGVGPHAGLTLADPLTLDLSGFDGVVVSPGVPLNRHPVTAHARRFGIPIIGDIELFALARPELPPHKVVGITGTNGKSTTTALIHHILKTAGVPTAMGGNIGLPILGQDPLTSGGVYVLELSSFQIDLTFSLDCDVAVLLNITPDHLDRYDSFEAYAAAKERLFAMQSAGKAAIIAGDDASSRDIHLRQWMRPGHESTTILVHGSQITNSEQAEWPALQGPHNGQNAAVAIAAARLLGLDDTAIATGLRTYPGLPHRMEIVRTVAGVRYVNDSKATNPDSVAPALRAFPNLHWILGGQAKTPDLDACLPHLAGVKAAYVIGEAAPLFADILAPHLPVTRSGTLAQAVNDTAAAAQPDDTVLLSPACASFDQFRDYEDRGDQFRTLVHALKDAA
ncbi:UDP-N-acetylmuramoyl-L-alanine--D-glutamate ligase [Sandaracinobacteroides saxicola]|uniref:UDP-N-acetylmuramoylalanine--D-glutamate ligase n=1 Tax=Sandaracinobacteroides saxicola TaxID=2759707 RepID=A0A7G5IG85_9SPHN|nr:UDP-N-acetylmuramoyl-L-alanine--D-glutamate ligase [Sandaracinobacteroides saxicola]QMW22377.1 UDP-N-acetylmuramoyl-L-alanine--D-glutamate ligase [Sandaracinobacteroides saxicola]